jgi:hypothetical protein
MVITAGWLGCGGKAVQRGVPDAHRLALDPWFGACAFLLFHLWRRWPSPRAADVISRRNFLKLAGVVAGGLAAAVFASGLAERLAASERPRRFTGSQGFLGRDFP